jgi:hypothetical protein
MRGAARSVDRALGGARPRTNLANTPWSGLPSGTAVLSTCDDDPQKITHWHHAVGRVKGVTSKTGPEFIFSQVNGHSQKAVFSKHVLTCLSSN